MPPNPNAKKTPPTADTPPAEAPAAAARRVANDAKQNAPLHRPAVPQRPAPPARPAEQLRVQPAFLAALQQSRAQPVAHDRVRVFVEGPGASGVTEFVEVAVPVDIAGSDAILQLIAKVSAQSTDNEIARLTKLSEDAGAGAAKLAAFKRGE